jgi:hypothetical protein
LCYGPELRQLGAGTDGDHDVASIPEITRMIARVQDWKERAGKARGHADTDRVLGEAATLFDDVSDMLSELRRELLGGGRREALPASRIVPRERMPP